MNKFFILFILLFSILTFCRCKKDNSPDYFITMSIDNKSFSFNDSLFASAQTGVISTQADKGLLIEGYSKLNGRAFIELSSISIGTYKNLYDTTLTKKAVYYFTVTATIRQDNNVFIETLIRPDTSVANSISVTLNNSNSTYVEGTFSGKLNNGLDYSVISNGKFKVPFK